MADYTIPDGWGTSPSSSTSPAATSPLPKQQSTLDLSEFDPFSETPASPPPPPPAEDPALSTPAKPESRSKPSTTEPRAETPQQQQTPSTSVISSIAATFKRTTAGSGEKKKAREEGSTREGSERSSVEEEKRSSSEQAGGKGVDGSKRPAVKPKPAPQFDFPKFLEQLKSKPADPVQKFLKSFLTNFAKKSFTMNEMIKLVHDFLVFIEARMREVEPWKSMDEPEFDTCLDCMEKLVMNRLYPFTFTPTIDRTRHPITTDDLEKDAILRQRIQLFSWVEGKHLDIDDSDEASRGYLEFAQQELLKVNHYKAPRDKLICILNCCKVIFGLIRHLSDGKPQGADAFIPVLIFVTLRANPEHLISNVEYINRFRSASKLQSEAGYYLSSLMGSISFIEAMDHTSLSNISQEEFETHVSDAISTLPPLSPPTRHPPPSPLRSNTPSTSHTPQTAAAPFSTVNSGEEPASTLPPSAISSFNFGLNIKETKAFLGRTAEAAMRPVDALGDALGKLIDGPPPGEEGRWAYQQQQQGQGGGGSGGGLRPDLRSTHSTPSSSSPNNNTNQIPYQARVRSPQPRSFVDVDSSLPHPASPSPDQPPYQQTPYQSIPQHLQRHQSNPPPTLPSLSFINNPQSDYPNSTTASNPNIPFSNEYPLDDDDAFVDYEQLQRELDARDETQKQESLATIAQIFPTLDKELASLVLDAKHGELGPTIDQLLEMGSS